MTFVVLSVAINPSVRSQQISPALIDVPVRFDKVVGRFDVKNPTGNRLILDLVPYEFSKNEQGQVVVSETVAENVQLTPSTLSLASNQQQTVRVSLDIPSEVNSREVAVCTIEKKENVIGQQSSSNLILRNCMKVSGNRKTTKLQFDNIK